MQAICNYGIEIEKICISIEYVTTTSEMLFIDFGYRSPSIIRYGQKNLEYSVIYSWLLQKIIQLPLLSKNDKFIDHPMTIGA